MHGWFASLGIELGDEAFLLEENQGIVGVVGTRQAHPQLITPTAVMLTDERDDGDAEKSDVLVAINCVTRLQKNSFETTHWEMAQCFITMLKKAVYEIRWEATSIPTLKQRIKVQAWQIPLPTILRLFNTVKEQLAVCA